MVKKPHLVVTSGEPAGIGPDLALMLAAKDYPAQITVIGSKQLLEQRARQLQLDVVIDSYVPHSPRPYHSGHLNVLSMELGEQVNAGDLNPANSRYVLAMLERAAKGCLNNEFDAVITTPVHKGVINDAGIIFSGHTEFFAEITGGQLPVMMLATLGLRVALATTHLPLKEVSAAVTKDVLRQVISVLDKDLREKFGISKPQIYVCGLNPHAGEGGYLGREEIDTINPVLEEFKSKGVGVVGSLPADTIFTPKYLQKADVILAMYHDQGLAVLKHKGFGNAANITLGLPIIRTSVDHGTALDLAGTGNVGFGSMDYAIRVAIEECEAAQKSEEIGAA
ncbi:MAG: 4-hydroxythreonine-4-phosphate dehydrogenase PdxA [Gammaproteobacteria bacterium]|nr:MAG: 4-hydroxythreonine-4-phosphate dehydrogenase PdxA [Gammaproteobacteria bacterium]